LKYLFLLTGILTLLIVWTACSISVWIVIEKAYGTEAIPISTRNIFLNMGKERISKFFVVW